MSDGSGGYGGDAGRIKLSWTPSGVWGCNL